MAKTIKFNLICDDKPVRTIEDLQNNFSVEDVLAYYDNKLLHRWLEVRGYADELKKVNDIVVEKPIDVIGELIKIFNITKDEKKIKKDVYIFEYQEEKKELYAIYEKDKFKAKNIIDDYEIGYKQLVDGILNNPYDIAKIKANIEKIVTEYAWILQLNHRKLFYLFREKSALAIMCLLMNEQSRKYYLPIVTKKDDETDEMLISDICYDKDKADMYKIICDMIITFDFRQELGENLLSFSGVTDGYWKDLEQKGKKYMIIKIDKGDFVRSAGETGGDLGYDDILNKFVIVDGIDYKSNSTTHRLLYMEV